MLLIPHAIVSWWIAYFLSIVVYAIFRIIKYGTDYSQNPVTQEEGEKVDYRCKLIATIIILLLVPANYIALNTLITKGCN